MRLNKRVFVSSVLVLCTSVAWADSVDKTVIISPPQTLAIGHCSAPVVVEAQTANSVPANVPSNTRIYFDGSSSSLSFFSDSNCSISAANGVVMAAGTDTKSFYFKGSRTGTMKIYVSTYPYNNGQQYETLVSSTPSPTPSPSPSPTKSPSPSPAPSPSPTKAPSPTPSPSPTKAPSPTPSPSPSSSPIATSSNYIVGVTDDESGGSASTNSSILKGYGGSPMVRLVFGDSGWSTSFDASYVDAYGASNVLGQLYDSAFVSSSSPSVSTAVSVTNEYLAAFPDIAIWEVGNEINGAPGGGWLTGCPSDATTFTSSTPCVGVYYNVWKTVHAAGKPTALTFFWTGPNDIANTSPGYDLLGYAQHLANDLPDMAAGLDYIFVSYYGASGSQSPSTGTTVSDIESLFNSLHAMFPNAKLGWGEIGASSACTSSTESSQLASLNYYYSTIPALTSGATWVGGGFWWNWGEDATGQCASEINNALSSYAKQY